ncbi:hypothetical protein [Pseudoxanthomonas sp. JBR18]|uniref:hypothetical protein n=1 Tax=Pseudoxanthomonas sp. JBR18 TaxID=2969308 RepID=UPI002305D968|nr:hypothetical protein [Pseudoxanthomonas sp. JBR18]WCE03623.1 hypothetical protein PJ250_16235 [Pseudoxanthomonas sp. JBR18]
MALPAASLRLAQLLKLMTSAVLVGLPLLFILVAIAFWRQGNELSASLLLPFAVQMLPALPYLWAVCSARRAANGLLRGELFGSALSAGLHGMGAGVCLGALINLLLVPNALRWMTGHGSFAYFDLSGIVLTLVGVLLWLLGQVVERASRLQAELEGFV